MIRTALLSLLLLAGTAVAADPGGEYKGTYTSDDGTTSEKLRTVLKKGADNTWECKFFFNRGGDEIEGKVLSCSVDDKTLKSEYTAEVDGSALKITIDATLGDDSSMAGTYKALDTDGKVVDSGKWKASLSQ